MEVADFHADLAESLYHAREACRLYRQLGLIAHEVGACTAISMALLPLGAYEELRAHFPEVEQDHPREMMFYELCSTWPFDRTPAGLEWARRYLSGVEHFYLRYPIDEGHLRDLFFRLGKAERIFRELGRDEEFRRCLDVLRERLAEGGYRTGGVWRLEEKVELPELPADMPEDDWKQSREKVAHCGWTEIRLEGTPGQSINNCRYFQEFTGDFALQVKTSPGREVEDELMRCRRLIAGGQPPRLGPGSGGLSVQLAPHNELVLLAHFDTPGEVVFYMRRDAVFQGLGRGLLGEGPLQLRLERRGTTFAAYACNEGGPWYCCGRVDLPDWRRVEAGLGGRSIYDLNIGTIEHFEIHFRDLRLQAISPPAPQKEEGEFYPLPDPAYVADLPGMVAADARLLRLLEQVRRVGDRKLRPIDVRIVAATNRDLHRAIGQERFRRDLFYRLQGVDLHLPPLRERRDDIPHLVAHTLHHRAQRRGEAPPAITRRAMEILLDHDWPGNVRELLRPVERAADAADDSVIAPFHLSIDTSESALVPLSFEAEERQELATVLRTTRGNISAAARHLGISRNTLYRRMRRLGIQPTGSLKRP